MVNNIICIYIYIYVYTHIYIHMYISMYVLVTLTDVARKDQTDVMLREGCLLKGLVCPNLLPVIAACVDSEQQPLLIYNYNMESNLKKFLLRCKVSDISPHQVRTLHHHHHHHHHEQQQQPSWDVGWGLASAL